MSISRAVNSDRRNKIDSNQKEELVDPKGLEQKYQKSFAGVVDINISNLSVHPKLAYLIMNPKVKVIEEDINLRYDPTQAIPVVCPADTSSPLDLSNIGDRQFLVIQKLQTFRALQNLEQRGQFRSLVGHSMGTLMCYVVTPVQGKL